jgi:hypothetical protein
VKRSNSSSDAWLVSNLQVSISAGTFKGVGDKTIPNLSALCFVYSGIKHQASSIKLYLPFLIHPKLSSCRRAGEESCARLGNWRHWKSLQSEKTEDPEHEEKVLF